MMQLTLEAGAGEFTFSRDGLLGAASRNDLAFAADPSRTREVFASELDALDALIGEAPDLFGFESALRAALERATDADARYRERVAAAVLHGALLVAAEERRMLDRWTEGPYWKDLAGWMVAAHDRFDAPFCAYDGTHGTECRRRHVGLHPSVSLLACYLAEIDLTAGYPAGTLPDGSPELAEAAGAAIALVIAGTPT